LINTFLRRHKLEIAIRANLRLLELRTGGTAEIQLPTTGKKWISVSISMPKPSLPCREG
jgi:hypothetical protein